MDDLQFPTPSLQPFDLIIVGSGPSAVHAAWHPVQSGLRVLMLDAGVQDDRYAGLVPADRGFIDIRRSDPQQHRYFLGDDFEGIPTGGVRVGAQLTPPRQYLARLVPGFLSVRAEDFTAMETLALGGLGAGWGAGAFQFTAPDFDGWPVDAAAMAPHYAEVARRIGVAGINDDLAKYFGESADLLPPAETDSNGEAIAARYSQQRAALNSRGFFAGAPRLAVATREHAGRGPLRYRDTEFYADPDRAFYRAQFTVDELRTKPNFTYLGGHLVERFASTNEGVELTARPLPGGEGVAFRARAAIVAAGTLGTARIVLRSIDARGDRVPFVSNPYTYFPCVNLAMLGRPGRDARHCLTQLSAVLDPDRSGRDVTTAQFYSYRSLLNFKLVKECPLPRREALRVVQLLQSSLVVVGVHHADRPGGGKFVSLDEGSGRLHVNYELEEEELGRHLARERLLRHFLRALGCWPIQRVDPGDGASIHYAGTFPMSAGDRPRTTTPEGELRGAPGVFIADGSVLPHLPAKGLTLTLMANANRIGGIVAERLRR